MLASKGYLPYIGGVDKIGHDLAIVPSGGKAKRGLHAYWPLLTVLLCTVGIGVVG
jgi:hypothetical protein